MGAGVEDLIYLIAPSPTTTKPTMVIIDQCYYYYYYYYYYYPLLMWPLQRKLVDSSTPP